LPAAPEPSPIAGLWLMADGILISRIITNDSVIVESGKDASTCDRFPFAGYGKWALLIWYSLLQA